MRHATPAAIASTLALCLALCLAALSACSGSADSGAPDPSPSTSTSTPAPTPSQTTTPAPPVMPPAAKAHTKAGAVAFVEYFWQVVDYAQATGDTASVTAISVPGCKGCEGGVQSIDKVYAGGGTIHGGQTTTSGLQVELLKAGKLHLARVTMHLRFSSQTIDMPGTTEDETRGASRARDRLDLLADDPGWKVAQLTVLP